ncbi:MAG: 5'/3'-nucleotidase SurE [Methanomicrobiales archaeon]|nr:5'/3'-nucleotidase SurE [Methanomicrobiales archaeon]
MRPKILLTNDDGVTSEGLWAAYDALIPFADVTVVAPSTQQSAVGRSISIFEPIRVTKIPMHDTEAYSVGGKPTDSVIIGIYSLNLKPDLVVSGINIGENLSYESITTSGTVGAALEASNQGVPSIAFSLEVVDQGRKFDDPRCSEQNFGAAKIVIADICKRLLKEGFPAETHVINVNIPATVTGGYGISHLAEKLFFTGVVERFDPRGRPYYWINGSIRSDAKKGTDVYAVHAGRISITPITLDCTAYSGKTSLEKLFYDELS